MVLNHLTPKLLILYGVTEGFDTSYTVNDDSSIDISLTINYTIADIQSKLNSVEAEKTLVENDDTIDEEVKFEKLQDLDEVIEMLTKIKTSLDG